MQCTFNDPTIFKGIIDIITTITDDIVTLLCYKDNISVQCMDSSHVSTTFITINNDLFKSYKSNNFVIISISNESLKPIIKSLMKDDELSLIYLGNAYNTLNVVIKNDEGESIFKLKLINIEFADPLTIPDVEYSNMISTNKKFLAKTLIDIKNMETDSVRIIMENDKLEFECENDNNSLEIKPNIDQVGKIINNSNIDILIGAKYLEKIQKMLTICKSKILISLDQAFPIRFQFKISDNKLSESSIDYFIATKIKD